MCFFVSHLLEAWTQLQAGDNSLVSPQRVGGSGYIVSFPVCVFFVYKMKQSWLPSTYALSSPNEVMTLMCGMSLFWYLLLAKLQPVSLQNRLGKVYLNACCTHQGDMDPGQGDLVPVISIALPLRWPHGQSGSVPAVSFLLLLTGRGGDHISRLSPQYPCHRSPQEGAALGCEAGLFTTWRAPWAEGTGSLWWLTCQGMCSCCRWLWLTVTPWLSWKHETVSCKSVLMSTPFLFNVRKIKFILVQ